MLIPKGGSGLRVHVQVLRLLFVGIAIGIYSAFSYYEETARNTLPAFHAYMQRSPISTTPSPLHFRLMSWNLRVPFSADATINRSWLERRNSIRLAIATILPDALLLQEDCLFMNDDLLQMPLLAERYERYGLYNRNGESSRSASWPENPFTKDGMKDGEHNSLWWNFHRFRKVDTSSFWLSKTPNVAGTSFDEVTGRIVNCVTLQDEPDGMNERLTRFCSTHMPAGNVTRQLLSTAVLGRELSQSIGYQSKALKGCFIGGDFNSIPGSAPFKDMLNRGFVNLHEMSTPGVSRNIENAVTTCDWFNSSNDALIDHIWFYNGDRSKEQRAVRVKQSFLVNVPCCDIDPDAFKSDLTKQLDSGVTIQRVPGDRAASDHMAVVMDLELVSVL